MGTPILSDDEVLARIGLVREHGSVGEAALRAGKSRGEIDHAIRLAVTRKMIGSRAELMARPVPSTQCRLPQTADECWQLLDAAIGRTRAQAKPPRPSRSSERRIVIASDFHAPFHHVGAVARMLDDTKGFDQIIINGDLQDSYSVSRFVKHETVPWERELAALDTLLSVFAAQYPDVLIVDGNHDRPRFEKALRSMLPLDMVHVLEHLTQGEFSTIRAMTKRKGYGNIRFAPIKVGRHSVAWCAQQGDLLVTHAEKYSKVPGSALRGIEEWFSDQHDILGLEPWRVLVQAHTHALGWIPWRSDRLLVEQGCMCHVHGYQLDAKVAGRGQRLGYVTLTQRDGVTDMSSVRTHWLDPVLRAA
jgi:predicted phosphodiesterase